MSTTFKKGDSVKIKPHLQSGDIDWVASEDQVGSMLAIHRKESPTSSMIVDVSNLQAPQS